jgi:RimJ/RimL family protein N-acetyltransferase
MHSYEPSIIAVDSVSQLVVGYIIAAPRSLYGEHPILDCLMDSINSIKYGDTLVEDLNYVLVGQVCIAKAYRGQGLLSKMYQYYKESLQLKYECCITEIDDKNQRSLKGHIKAGFEIIHSVSPDVSQH